MARLPNICSMRAMVSSAVWKTALFGEAMPRLTTGSMAFTTASAWLPSGAPPGRTGTAGPAGRPAPWQDDADVLREQDQGSAPAPTFPDSGRQAEACSNGPALHPPEESRELVVRTEPKGE